MAGLPSGVGHGCTTAAVDDAEVDWEKQVEEVAPGVVEVEVGRGDLQLAEDVSSCCASGGKVVT
jgi:hypothetical protein